jgi:hypothetical protein
MINIKRQLSQEPCKYVQVISLFFHLRKVNVLTVIINNTSLCVLNSVLSAIILTPHSINAKTAKGQRLTLMWPQTTWLFHKEKQSMTTKTPKESHVLLMLPIIPGSNALSVINILTLRQNNARNAKVRTITTLKLMFAKWNKKQSLTWMLERTGWLFQKIKA